MSKLLEFKNSKSGLKIVNKAETVAEVLLYGPIGESFWESSISAKQFHDELKKLPASIKEIHLRVNSPGGSVFDGMAIYENIKSQRSKGKKVYAYIDGVAASIASIIVLAADEILIGDGGMYMIHKPLSFTYGNSIEHERIISVLDKIEEQMITIYAKKTGMSRNEISTALAKETYYNSDEALDYGFVDSKIEAKDSLSLAASAMEGCPWLKNRPEMKSRNDLVREKLHAFNARNKEFLSKF